MDGGIDAESGINDEGGIEDPEGKLTKVSLIESQQGKTGYKYLGKERELSED